MAIMEGGEPNVFAFVFVFVLLLSGQVCKIGNHVNKDVDALEEDGLIDELVVVVEEDLV